MFLFKAYGEKRRGSSPLGWQAGQYHVSRPSWAERSTTSAVLQFPQGMPARSNTRYGSGWLLTAKVVAVAVRPTMVAARRSTCEASRVATRCVGGKRMAKRISD